LYNQVHLFLLIKVIS